MAERMMITVDGNTACATVAHKINEVIAIYPITPSSSMGRVGGRALSQGRDQYLGICALGRRNAG